MSRDLKNFAQYLCVFVLLIGAAQQAFGQYQHFLDRENELYEYIDTSYPIHNVAHGDNEFAQLVLDNPVHFFSQKYDQIFINTNGILTFNIEYAEFINQPLPLEYPSIAPFYANVDTTGAPSSTSITIFETKNSEQLSRANNFVRYAFTENPSFQADKLIVATWKDVGYFNGRNDKLNTFQVIIILNNDETFVQFIYPAKGINWVRAEIGESGLPDIRAQAGFVSEDSILFTLEDSGTSHVRFLSENSNAGASGVWLYKVGPLQDQENIQSPTNVEFLTEPPVYQQETCLEGSRKYCDDNASCMDKTLGFCCSCQEGFYGNGHVCLENDSPVRVIGTLKGRINGEPVDERAKLQSYISTSDAHTYTALTPLSSELASQLRLALPLVTATGWLFAKPVKGALNGYQLSGGELQHYSELLFETGEVLYVNQTFEGLNYWDQLAVNIDIQGEVPRVSSSARLVMNDFIEEFLFTAPNQLQSRQSHQYEVADENRKINFQLIQSIRFERCLLDEQSDPSGSQILQKVSRIVLDYLEKDQAWRPSVLTKVGVDVESNACTDGTAQCGENSVCTPYEDTYSCSCMPGFNREVDENNSETCVDIDECTLGIHFCDDHALCSNTLGGFNCVCWEGYQGDGRNCLSEDLPENIESSTAESQTPSYEENTEYVTYPSADPPQNTVDECHRCSIDADCYNGQCFCREGFRGNGYTCESLCHPNEIWEEGKCLPYNYFNNEEIEPHCNLFEDCTCPEGYELEPERQMCVLIDVNYEIPCDVVNNCHANATCEWHHEDLKYFCQCKPGLSGDGHHCYITEESCAINEGICDPHASCNYNDALGKSECQCNRGYEGDGFRCTLSAECQIDSDCGPNTFCENGICLCQSGFERDNTDACVQIGRCGSVFCGPNTLCKYDAQQDVQYCDCMEGYEGDATLGCKSIPPPCNVINNCGVHATCEPTEDPQHYECQCNAGFHGDGYVCIEDENCLNNPHLCDMNARCSSTTNGLVCVCNEGFYGNGSVCLERQQHESGFLLVSQGVVIVRVPLNGKNIRPIAVTSMAIGLDKDCLEGRIYWGDISTKKIISAKYDGSDTRDFISDDIESPEGIAIDSISRRIYWTDSVKDTIEVASLEDPSLRAVLINKNLVNPRGIAVDPLREKLYWSDWNREAPKIEMSDLDGTGREVLLAGDKIKLPNSLVVLEDRGELCFADAGTKIVGCIDGYSKQARNISNDLTYPFGLANTQDSFYWTDWMTKKLESVNAYGVRQKPMQTPFFGSHKMYGMTAVNEFCPHMDSPCSLNNGGCIDNRICLVNRMAPSGKSCKCTPSSQLCKTQQIDYTST